MVRESQRTVFYSSHQAPLPFFRSPFFVPHPNELCALEAGSPSGPGWYVGWGHSGVSCVRNIFGNLSILGYFKMDDAKVPGQPEETCRGILQWTSVSLRGNNNTSHSEAGIATMIYAYLQSLSLQNLVSNLEVTGGMAGFIAKL